jgi:hypothetical protein
MRKEIKLTVFAAGVALVAAACGDSTTGATAASDQFVDLDVAVVAADGTLGDLEAIAQCGGGRLPEEGAEVECTVTYFDADGNQQAAYDEVTTASIHIVSEISGEFEREGWSATVSRSREMTISGLEGAETTRTVNGSGSQAVTRSSHSDANGSRTYEMSGTSSIDNVVHGVPREDHPYPLSGSITREMTATIIGGENDGEVRSRLAVITFNGTQFATMTVNGETYEIDLAARRGQGPMRGGGRRPGP